MWPSFSPLGNEGYPLIGETPNFLRNMMDFIQTRIVQYGAIFKTHLLGKTTVIATSYEGVLNVLQRSPIFHAHVAYNEFLSIVYPNNNFLLAHDGSACRESSENFLNRALYEKLHCYQIAVRTAISKRLDSLFQGKSKRLGVYAVCKPLAEDALLVALFGPDLSAEEVYRLRTLASEHLNGVVTTAVSLHARRRARRAYDTLKMIVHSRIAERMSTFDNKSGSISKELNVCSVSDVAGMMVQSGEINMDDAVNSMIVLTSAVVGKAVASVASSSLDFLAKDKNLWHSVCRACTEGSHKSSGADLLDKTMMESMRLMPPLAGVIRVHNNEDELRGNSALPDGCRMWGSVIHANRDPGAYPRANEFRPCRWSECAIDDGGFPAGGCPFAWPGEEADTARSKLPLTFGCGVRRCKGRELAWMLVREIVGSVVVRLDSFDCNGVSAAEIDSEEVSQAPAMNSIRVFPVVRLVDNQSFSVEWNGRMKNLHV